MFRKEFELRYLEMNRHGEASPMAILTLLEETAADHCLSIDYGLYDLLKQNVGWVLISGYMQMDRYPKYKEKITIETWLSTYKKIRGIRENLIYDEQGVIIGRARGLWLFYDLEKRRPAKIFEEIINRWDFNTKKSIDYDFSGKITPIDSGLYSEDITVKHYDMDTNRHVNNIRYLQWLMETLPDKILDNYDMHTIDGRFIGEAHFGDEMQSYTNPTDDKFNFIHSIKDINTNKFYASATTSWKKR